MLHRRAALLEVARRVGGLLHRHRQLQVCSLLLSARGGVLRAGGVLAPLSALLRHLHQRLHVECPPLARHGRRGDRHAHLRRRGGRLAERVVARLRLERAAHALGRVVLALDVHHPLAVDEVPRRGAAQRHLVWRRDRDWAFLDLGPEFRARLGLGFGLGLGPDWCYGWDWGWG